MNRSLFSVGAAALSMTMLAGCEFMPVIDNGPSEPSPQPSPQPRPTPRPAPTPDNSDSTPQREVGNVTGSAMLKVKMAVNPDATLVVELIEMAPFVKGQTQAEPKRLADYRVPTKGKSGPWSFTLPYDKAAIDQSKLYGVQAKIMLGDEVLFKSAKASMVLTNGKDDKTNVTLAPAN